jgi:hypothetical protein
MDRFTQIHGAGLGMFTDIQDNARLASLMADWLAVIFEFKKIARLASKFLADR